jgi:hypothetical protein
MGAWAWVLLAAVGGGAVGCGRGGPASVRIRQTTWRVEVVTTPESRQKGLSNRGEVPAGAGMLFAFPRQEVQTFHMLDCRVGLDVAFISDDLTVVEVRTMAVEEDPGHPRYLYPSRRPARLALEVAAGELERAGVKVGDRVELLGAARDAAKGAR